MESTPDIKPIIDHIRGFLRDAGKLSSKVEELLRTYGGIERHMKVLFKELSASEHKNIQVVKKVCEDVIFGEYLSLKSKGTALSITASQIEEKEPSLPTIFQPKAMEIRGYSVQVLEQIHKAEKLLQEIEEKLNDVEKKGYEITKAESIKFQIMCNNFDSCLRIASNDHKRAEEVLNMLGNDVTKYYREQFGITVGLTLAAAAGSAGVGAAVGNSTLLTTGVAAISGGGLVGFIRGLYVVKQRNKIDVHHEKLSRMLSRLKQTLTDNSDVSETARKNGQLFLSVN